MWAAPVRSASKPSFFVLAVVAPKKRRRIALVVFMISECIGHRSLWELRVVHPSLAWG